jgi:hypothetical protein
MVSVNGESRNDKKIFIFWGIFFLTKSLNQIHNLYLSAAFTVKHFLGLLIAI